ncbi:MAG: TonB-dependent receptor [Muribaculaceae bacterium]|nr:TonB-dependent receptor [Muribaculaceae bacterium]
MMALLASILAAAALAGPVKSDTLKTVEVVGQRHVARRVQVLEGAELKRLNSHSVADAMRYFGGVQVKDYGGVGGVKTVNVRSMGASHVGVSYDGVSLGNAQNGQIDLGQFSLDNVEEISLANGRQPRLLQPAREFGAAAQVSLRTRRPAFAPDQKPWRLRASIFGGSFDLIGGAATVETRLSPTLNASFSADALNASGRYKFRVRGYTPSGTLAYDTTAIRHNGDIFAARFEANLYGTVPCGSWSAKAYTFNSNRGIPGAIVANVWRRGERLRDSNSFAQGSFQGQWGRWQLLCNAKYAFYDTHYSNHDSRTPHVDHRYRQHEAYLSASTLARLTGNWSMSLSYDLLLNQMTADLTGFQTPLRFTNMIALASALQLGPVNLQASGLATLVNDKIGQRSRFRHAITPSLSLDWQVWGDFRLSAMAKQSFRMPTFNDLYYTDAGNAALRPERVSQADLGAAYHRQRPGEPMEHLRLSATGFYSRVSDKIIAYPKGQQFRWTMLNLGEVDIRGVELSGRIGLLPARDWRLTLLGQYTFQRAIDITDPDDTYYRHQIPYTPRHSASASATLGWRSYSLSYSFIYVGQRWNQQENIPRNYMSHWTTSDLSLMADFNRWRVQLEINNLLNQQYAVILNYPMPGRNFRATVAITL